MSTTGPTTQPPGVHRRSRRRSEVAALAVLATLAGCSGSDDDATDDAASTVVPSGGCFNEPAVVEDARRAWGRSADIDGDGASDTVFLAKDEDPDTAPSCRTFVGVDTGDVTYSARASVLGYPEITGAAVFRLVQLGGSDGAVVISEASERDPDRRQTVDRRFFSLSGDDLKPRGETTRRVAPDTPLAAALPEFTRPMFGGC